MSTPTKQTHELDGLTVEQYAAIRARLQLGTADTTRALAEEGVTPEVWTRASAAWASALADDVAKERRDRLSAFAAAYREAHAKHAAARALEAAPASVDETAFGVAAMGEALPFTGASAPPPPAALAESAPHANVGATHKFRIPIDETLPFVARGEIDLGSEEPDRRMELRRYASLEAELAAGVHDRPTTFQRYGISAADYATLAAQWARRFERDVDELALFRRLVADFRAWLSAHGTRG